MCCVLVTGEDTSVVTPNTGPRAASVPRRGARRRQLANTEPTVGRKTADLGYTSHLHPTRTLYVVQHCETCPEQRGTRSMRQFFA